MTKILLLIALVFAVWWLWRHSRKLRSGSAYEKPQREAERMVQCARCGVNQPVSESILANGRYYCCAAHLRDPRSDDA
ncbi:conserved hypothetical protein [Candidatus Accumulibacter aalborgensis]|uniref:MYND finger n=1 Tax=Candidatus Accumulibacter aalborgensis TaxID=1860102 RepID=A0A1A8XGT9_9PROT|nr:PP0621 family protein [Candidatus Accumulibacter aalborgensis]SBT03153.1 conserved hypothetical protein [Candidatus Accumulibacter aalborgensis]